MAISLQLSRSAAEKHDGQGIVIVLIAVAHAAAVENHRMVEQIAVAVRRLRQFFDEVSEHLYVVFVDHRERIHIRLDISVMRSAVESAAIAAGGVARGAE